MQDPRFDNLLKQLESVLADYQAQRREQVDGGQFRLQALSSQIEQLQAENRRLRERQEAVCGRLERLLNELEPVEEHSHGG
ncbi:MAG: hypothetical protein ACOY4L_04390 [Pseudomonadota bacterium]